MDNPVRKIINNEYWEIRETAPHTFWVINTHQLVEAEIGSTQPNLVEKFTNKDDAINFLEEQFSNSINKP